MTDEDHKKKIVSEPPPPTDDIDQEWGTDGTKTEVAPKPTTTTAAAPAPVASSTKELPTRPAVGATRAAVEDDEDEDEDEDELDEDEDEDEEADEDEDEDDEDAHQPRTASARVASRPSAPRASNDWLPDWAPYAVLALLVLGSLVGGLGLVGDPPVDAAEEAEPAPERPVQVRQVTPDMLKREPR